MADAFAESARRLGSLALTHDCVLVMYSGGKDSLATMDLCVKTFRRVVAVHMWFVPGLAVMEARLDFARKRWGVEILPLPHWMVPKFLRRGIYCFPVPGLGTMKLADVYALAREQTGVRLLASGGKRSDGLWRRRQMAREDDGLVYPVAGWSKWDVLAYLAKQGIEAPPKFDLDLSAGCILWLADEHPDDYRRLLEVYPHAEAVLRRREWFGIAPKTSKKSQKTPEAVK